MISLSFDDGRIDNFTLVWPMLRRYQLSATFNICTGYVLGLGNCPRFSNTDAMTPDMVREIFTDKSMEIASHGHLHQAAASDLSVGIDTLLELLGVESLCDGYNGLAIPHNRISDAEWRMFQKVMADKKVGYVRKSVRYQTHGRWKRWCRKASRIIPFSPLYLLAHTDSLLDNDIYGLVYSVPVMASTTPSNIMALVNKAVEKKKHLVLQFHSVADNNHIDSLSYHPMWFETIVAFLAKAQDEDILKVVTTMELARTRTVKTDEF